MVGNFFSVLFFRLNSSNCFPVETHVLERSRIFVEYSVGNHGALNFCLQMVALPA